MLYSVQMTRKQLEDPHIYTDHGLAVIWYSSSGLYVFTRQLPPDVFLHSGRCPLV